MLPQLITSGRLPQRNTPVRRPGTREKTSLPQRTHSPHIQTPFRRNTPLYTQWNDAEIQLLARIDGAAQID